MSGNESAMKQESNSMSGSRASIKSSRTASDVNLRITNTPGPDPPSYESVFDSVKNAKSRSDTFLDYLRDVNQIIKKRIGVYGTLIIIIIICLSIFLFPLIEVIIGSLYLSECVAEKNIPVYLILVGIFVLAGSTCCVTGSLRHRFGEGKGDDGDIMAHRCTRACSVLLYFICFILLIIGSAWIFGVQDTVQFTDENKPTYCIESLYNFAYYTTIIKWIVTILIFISGTTCLGGLCCIFMVKEVND